MIHISNLKEMCKNRKHHQFDWYEKRMLLWNVAPGVTHCSHLNRYTAQPLWSLENCIPSEWLENELESFPSGFRKMLIYSLKLREYIFLGSKQSGSLLTALILWRYFPQANFPWLWIHSLRGKSSHLSPSPYRKERGNLMWTKDIQLSAKRRSNHHCSLVPKWRKHLGAQL